MDLHSVSLSILHGNNPVKTLNLEAAKVEGSTTTENVSISELKALRKKGRLTKSTYYALKMYQSEETLQYVVTLLSIKWEFAEMRFS